MNLFNYRSVIRRKIVGGGIFLLLILATGQVFAQSKAVSGTVKSQQGEPLAGVTILIEGTTQGTSTDAQGAFTLSAKPDDMLAVSYLGYKSQRIKVGPRTKLEVVMTEDQNLMDEVVVVGYGTQRRRNIVGAVENISGEVLENRPNAYLLRSIQGQIPGVNITMADGKPSRSATINIRANTQSIGAGGAALCLIDGVEGDLTAMNPEDVESISVLKDASSTAVYGARGAFGVVLVTTKKAHQDKISVDYSGSVSIISETVRPKYETDSQTWYDNYMTAYVGYSHHLPTGINNFFPWTQSWEDEYKKRMNDPDQSYLDWGLDASGKYQYYGRNTDWYDMFYKKSTTAHQHNIRISGGGAVNTLWCQIFADLFQAPVRRVPEYSACGALGAAVLASHHGKDPASLPGRFASFGSDRTFEPDASKKAVYDDLFAVYTQIYPASKGIFQALKRFDETH